MNKKQLFLYAVIPSDLLDKALISLGSAKLAK
jgi:hypothetical protein